MSVVFLFILKLGSHSGTPCHCFGGHFCLLYILCRFGCVFNNACTFMHGYVQHLYIYLFNMLIQFMRVYNNKNIFYIILYVQII